MNKIHRVVWSERLGGWIAVAEIVRGRGKRARSALATALMRTLATMLSALAAGAASAAPATPTVNQLPSGAQVSAGSATVSQSVSTGGATLNVNQGTQRAVVNWSTFDVGANAQVNFNQPSSSSVTLNRVLDTHPSQILGRIVAPGQVVISNPNGVLFGASASVDVGGLTATTHGISDADFMAGKTTYTRQGATGAVVNAGQLRAALGGYIALLAPEVRNDGVIIAQAGTVTLAAGEAITLNFGEANRLTGLTVTPAAIRTLVTNRHAVLAPDGLIILSARAADQLQGSVVNSGTLAATSLTAKGGRIVLEGDAITIAGTSTTQADGATGGGTVLVGGDWQGDNGGQNGMHQATTTVVQASAVVSASATVAGDGGKVVVWSDTTRQDSQTTVRGSVQARGAGGGAGGKIETSGHQLDVEGSSVNAGQGGNWLLDPWNVTIGNGGSDTGGSGVTTGSGGTWTPNATGSTISNTTINGALNNGQSVIVATTGAGAEAGDITVSGAISKTAGAAATLSLNASGSIFLNNNITSTSNALTTNLTAAAGSVGGSGTLTTNGGLLTVSNATAGTLSGTINGSGGLAKAGIGTLTLSGSNINFSGATTVNAGTLALIDTINNNSNLTIASGATLSLNNTLAGFPNRYSLTGTITGAGNVTIDNAVGGYSGGWTNFGGNLHGGTAGLLAGFTGTVTVNSGVLSMDNLIGLWSSSANLIINGGAYFALRGQSISMASLNGAGDVVNSYNGSGAAGNTLTVNGTGNSTFSGVIHGQVGSGGTDGTVEQGVTNLVKSGTGTLTLTGANTYGGTTTISAGTLNVGAGGASGGFGIGTVTNNASLVINRSDAVSLSAIISNAASITGTGSMTVSSGGNLTVDRTINLTGASSAVKLEAGSTTAAGTASGGDVTLSNTVTVPSAGKITIFSGNPNTTTLMTKLAGATGATKFKTYNAAETDTAGATAGTRNFYYRANPVGTITGVTASSKVYDGSTTATLNTTGAIASGVDGDTVAITGGYAGAFADKNVGTGKTVNIGAVVTATSSGWTISRGYSSAVGTTSANITQAALTLSGSRVYDGTSAMAGANLTATGVAGETFAVTGSGAAGNLATRNVQNNQALASVSGLSLGASGNGGLASNYAALSTTGSQVSVTPAALTVSTANVIKTYDGNTTAAGAMASVSAGMLAAGDSLSGGTFAYTDKNAGNGSKTVTVSGVTVNDGNGGANYTLTQVNNITSTITPAALVLSGSRLYDGTTVMAGPNLTATGVGSETFTVTGSGAAGNLSSRNVQSNQALASVSGLALGTGVNGALASNYAALSTAGSQISVTPAALTVSTANVIKTYDGNTTAAGATASVSAGTLATGDTLSGGTFAFTDKNAGVGNKTLTVSGVTVSDGNGGANYTLTQVNNTTSTINPAALTLAGSRVYDGSTVMAGASLTATGVAGETFAVTGSGAAGNLSTRNVQTNQALASVGGLALGASGNGGLASNYTALTAAGSRVDVTPAALTVSTANVSKTYDGTTVAAGAGASVSSGTLFAGDALIGGTFAYTDRNAGNGNKTITVSGITLNDGNGGANYTLTQANNTTSTITPAALVLSGSRVYDGSTVMAGANLTATGVGSETFSVTGAGAAGNLSTRNVQTNQALASVSGLSLGAGGNGALAGNYTALSTAGSQVSVTPAALTVSTGNVTKTYDGGTTATGATASVSAGTLATGDTLNGGNFAFGDKNAGNGNKTVTVSGVTVNDGNGGANYTLTQVANTTSTINPAALTLSGSRVYDGTTVMAGANLTATGVGSETFTVTGAGAAGNLSTRNVQTNQALAGLGGLALGASVNGGVASNYAALSTTGSQVSVTPAALTVSTANVIKTYDGNAAATGAAASVSAGTLAAGDMLSGGTFAFTDRNAGNGNKTVTVSGVTVNDGNGGANYTLTQANNTTSTITPATLVLSGSRVYDGTTTMAGANLTATGVGSETFSVTGVGAAGNLATRNVQSNQALASVSGLALGASSNGGVASNYTALSATGSQVSVTPAALTVSTANVNKTYDGSTTATGAAASVSAGTLATGDTLVGGTFAFTDRNAGNGNKTVTVSGITVNDGNGGANYALTQVNNTTSTINPASLVLSAVGDTKIYDTTRTSTGTVSVSGLAAGDSVSGLRQSFDSRNAGARTLSVDAGYTISDGNGGNNYTVTVSNAGGGITRASLQVTGVSADTKAYDGTVAATLSGGAVTALSGDSVQLVSAAASGAFADANAGTGKSVTATGYALSGPDAGNYNLVPPSGVTGDITRRVVTVTGLTADSRTYDGTPAVNIRNWGSVTTGVGSETLVLNHGMASFGDPNAGTGKTVTASGYTLANGAGGGQAGNYQLSSTSATTSADIAKALVTVTANGDAKIVTQADQAGYGGVSYSNFVAGESAATALSTLPTVTRSNGGDGLSTGTQAAGNYTAVLVPSGATAQNYTFSYANGDYAIMPASQLLVRVVNQSNTYGTQVPYTITSAQYLNASSGLISNLTLTGSIGNTYSYSDGVGGTAAFTLTPTSAVYSTSGNLAVGNYALGGANTSIGGSNFNTLVFTGSQAVTAKVLTVGATAGITKTYDGSTALTGLRLGVTGSVGPDAVSVSGSGAFDSKNASVNVGYTVSGLALSGADSGNYVLSGTSVSGSNGTINPAALVLSGTRTYDGTTAMAGANLTATGVAGETFAVTGSGAAGNLATRNVQNNQALASVSGLSLGASGNGGLAGNYTALSATGSQVIVTPAALTVSTANVIKTYDGNTTATGAAASVSAGTLATGDTLNGGIFAYTDRNAGNGNKTVMVSGITVNDGNGGANYTLTQVANTTSTITPAALTLSGARVYDGTTAMAGANLTATGVAGETFAVTGNGAAGNLSTRNVQTNQALASVSGLALGAGGNGALASNYAALSATGSRVSITPAPLELSAVSDTRTYDATRASGGAVRVSGLVAGDAVSNLSQSFDSRNAGARTLSVDKGYAIDDGNGGANYVVGTRVASGTIVPRSLSVNGSSGIDKPSDGTTALPAGRSGTSGLSGVLGNDQVTLGGAAAYDSAAVGARTITRGTLALNGADAGNYALRWVDGSGIISTPVPQPQPVPSSPSPSPAPSPSPVKPTTPPSVLPPKMVELLPLSPATPPTPVVTPPAIGTAIGGMGIEAVLQALADARLAQANGETGRDLSAARHNSDSSAPSRTRVEGNDEPRLTVWLIREPAVDRTGVVTVEVPSQLASGRRAFTFGLPDEIGQDQPADAVVRVRELRGRTLRALPHWLRYVAATRTFVAERVPRGGLPIRVVVDIGVRHNVVLVFERDVR